MTRFSALAQAGSLADLPDRVLSEPGALVRERALRAARALMVQTGLDVSMERIAEASGLGRRTLFRHFESRDALIGAALDSAFAWYEKQQLASIDHPGPLSSMLRESLRRVHRSHLDAGRSIWQLACAFDDELPREYEAANRRRRGMRHRLIRGFADRAWALAGGKDSAPDIILESFTLLFSSFTTHSMLIDRDTGQGMAVDPAGPEVASRLERFVEMGAQLLELRIAAQLAADKTA